MYNRAAVEGLRVEFRTCSNGVWEMGRLHIPSKHMGLRKDRILTSKGIICGV